MLSYLNFCCTIFSAYFSIRPKKAFVFFQQLSILKATFDLFFFGSATSEQRLENLEQLVESPMWVDWVRSVIELHYGTVLETISWPRVLQYNLCVVIAISDSAPKTSPSRNSCPSSLTHKVKMAKIHLTLFSLCSFRAPEISLNAGEDHKGFIHSDSIGEYNSVDGGLHQPLLSDASQPTNYSV